MKSINYAKLAILITMSSLAVGCAKEKKVVQDAGTYVVVPPNGSPYVPPDVGPGSGSGGVYGSTAALTFEGATALDKAQRVSQYANDTRNNPSNGQINLNLLKYGSTYGGTVSISYVDNGIGHLQYFTGGNTSQATQYNVLYSNGGSTVFHGFFEDFIGGIVVVIDQIVDLGDGQGPQDGVGGSIWFKNFGAVSVDHHPPTYCWFVRVGPYDCRSWISGKTINPYAAVNPDNGYVKLGTFTNLSLKKAFNNNL